MSKDLKINDQIRTFKVRIVHEDDQLGIFSLQEAKNMARDRNLDLVEVSPNAEPPVCKFLDYGKYKYYQSKVDHKHRMKQRSNELKEIRLSARISDHDLQTKVNKARKFIEKGDKVKINLLFRGREMAYFDLGKEKLIEFATMLEEVATVEKEITKQGHSVFTILKPLN